MKNLKKVLSLVLALALALSLMTTAFGAVTKASSLTGYDKVGTTYTQAVDMMVALGVIDGVSGDIQAQGNVTREQAAKIICTMLLGSNASQLSTTSAYFTDVPATRWSAPYIAYCVEKGIVSGVGGGKFNPTGNVTGNQFAKMLLVALGYKADVEGYTGTNWATNVSSDAVDAGIFKNATALDKNTAATREQACLYAWNTINATMVKYATTGTNITIGNTNINVGGSSAEAVTSSEDYSKNLKGWNTSATSGTVEFGEKYFSTLKKTNVAEDSYGRPAAAYQVGSTTVGTYASTATLTYTKLVTYGTIYSDLGLAKAKDTDNYYIDGKPQSTISLTKGSTSTIGGVGVLTQVYYDSTATTPTLTIVSINTYLSKVSSVTAATSSANRYVTLATAVTANKTLKTSNVDTDNFAKGDYVRYNVYYNGTTLDNYSIDADSMSVAENATNVALTSTTGTTKFVAGGTTYNYAATCLTTSPTLNDQVNVYLDSYGNALYVASYSGTVDVANYLKVTAKQQNTLSGVTQAAVTKADGSTAVITVAKLTYNNSGTATTTAVGATIESKLIANAIYSYTVNSDGTYVLKEANTNSNYAYATATVKTGATALDNYATGTNTYTAGGTAYTFNNATVFVVKNTTKGTTSVYTGIKNMPAVSTVEDVSILTKSGSTTALLVFMDAGSSSVGTSSAADLIYILSTTATKTSTDGVTYCQYPAIISGAVTTVTTYGELSEINAKGLYLVNSYTNSNVSGITKLATTDSLTETGVTKTDYYIKAGGGAAVSFAGDVLKINGTSFTVNSNCKAYTVTALGAASEVDVSSLESDASNYTYYMVLDITSNANGYVTTIFAQK